MDARTQAKRDNDGDGAGSAYVKCAPGSRARGEVHKPVTEHGARGSATPLSSAPGRGAAVYYKY